MITLLKPQAMPSSLLALTLSTFSLVAARADMVINRFDSPAEVAAWRFDNGLPGGTFTFDPTQDAGSNSSSGSMKLVLPFTANGGFEYSLDYFPVATNLTAAGYTNISLDVKVDPASPASDDGTAGWFQLAIRADGDSHSFLRQYGENLNTNNRWFHISVPITGDVTATRGFTFQFSSGDFTNGTRIAWIDNLVLQGGGLSQKPAKSAAANQLVVWDGEKANKGAGWAGPQPCAVAPQTVESHSGDTALEFKFKGGGSEWLGMGWNWCAFETGPFGTDITPFKTFTFWMKTKGTVADVQLNLLCNGEKFDLPDHHTEKVSALTYCPQLQDGQWHKVSIPLADFTKPTGFDALHVGELQLFNAGEGDGTFYIDDISFEGDSGIKPAPAPTPANPAASAAVSASAEMLVNGNFADGTNNWVLVAESGATGRAEIVGEGPDGQAALRLKVLTIGDQPWRFQFYQTGLRVEKGKTYVMTFWAKSDRPGSITVNCMQNHEPWDHHTQEKMPVATAWQPLRFTFVAPWDDDNVRSSFTDLGTTPDQVYWFANCSLVLTGKDKASAASAPAAAEPVITLNQPIGIYSSPVAAHGALQVIGNHVCDAHGNPYQFKGMSLFWSQWSGPFYTKATINALAEDWRCSVVRAAMGAEAGKGGYLENPTAAVAKVKTVVDAAIAKGIYVIIDWHTEQAPSHVTQATAFFSQMATTYGSYPNVIFEIYNEPNGPQWPAIKTYAETVISAIRKTGSTNLVVVGTPKWSQDVDIAAADPLTDFKNVAYALHFYAGTHKQSLRDKATKAMSKGIALCVTEWGTCNSSGNGGLDLAESVTWLNFLKQNGISWINWSLNDKAETASALQPRTLVTGPPSASDLTPSGVFLYNNLVAP